ncbi:hypothetical protein CTI12_AA548700 [Artemisia annua]|uniref:Cytochrome P450 n=1 Tax=Artemisia annua TaxID=35608 RepID=A0A2U1KZ03_ARTAN|nr:hypothetical protein CTI12_AA548700 [Artemisia annua]
MTDEMNTKILCIRLGHVHVIAVSDPKIALEFMRDKDGIFSSRPHCVSGYLKSGDFEEYLTTEISSVARLKWLENKPHDVADNLLRYVYNQCKTNGVVTRRVVKKVLREAIHATRKYQDPLIDERIQQWKDGISNVEDDLLDVLINHDNPQLTTDQIKAQCLELMLAMVDNPSNSIEWAIAERINQPRLFDKAVHELDCLVGTDRLVQESDISKHDGTLRYGMPATFKPERHMHGHNQVVLTDNNLHLFSFGTGPRGCSGVLLGTTMTVLMLARLVQGSPGSCHPMNHMLT